MRSAASSARPGGCVGRACCCCVCSCVRGAASAVRACCRLCPVQSARAAVSDVRAAAASPRACCCVGRGIPRCSVDGAFVLAAATVARAGASALCSLPLRAMVRLPLPCAVGPRVAQAAATCLRRRQCVLLRRPFVRACCRVGVLGLSVRACCCVGRARSVRACVRRPRSPAARFIDFGRLYPGGGKQWSAPTPTMLWRRAVGPSGRHGRPRPVSSFSDVYTQEVGNNGRHQSLPCCGGAPSVRSAASVARGPFHRFRTFIPRRWETMVGTNPNLVVALRRPLGWCTV